MKFRDLIQIVGSNIEPTDLTENTEFDFTELNEVQFNEQNIQKVVILYSKILGKKFGGNFKSLGLEDFKRPMGAGKGYRVMNDAGIMLRFNWDSKLAKKAQFDLTSIDYWAKGNIDFQKPTRTVKFSPELNVVQVLDQIGDALKTGTINEAQEFIKEANAVLEARTPAEKQEWLISRGLPKSLAGSEKGMKARADQLGLGEELEVFLGQSETNSFEGEIKKIEKAFNEKVYSDPDTVFEDIEDLLGVVAAKKWRTLVVCGMGGIGKTFHITEGPRSLKALLGPQGGKWEYHSGTKASPLSFYQTLFEERDKIIVFDEADALLKHAEIVMMLKPILDTSGDNMAEYGIGTRSMRGKSLQEIEDYCKKIGKAIDKGALIARKKNSSTYDPFLESLQEAAPQLIQDDDEDGSGASNVMLPSKFQFTGSMIFISNMRANQIDQAIMSRSIFIDVYLAEQDVLKRIKTIGYAQAKGKSGITRADVDDVLEALGSNGPGKDVEVTYMTPEYARKHKQVTVRAMQLALILKKAGLSRWAELTSLYA